MLNATYSNRDSAPTLYDQIICSRDIKKICIGDSRMVGLMCYTSDPLTRDVQLSLSVI